MMVKVKDGWGCTPNPKQNNFVLKGGQIKVKVEGEWGGEMRFKVKDGWS